jgi:LmbE family N-acetylglucosaminyl deacetylase
LSATVIVILSPHLDDAVLSCWSVLTADEDVAVLNVFTGAPEAGSGARWWDRMTGAADSAERMRERLDEDRTALALAGREARGLGLLEAQYREANKTPDVFGSISSALPPGCAVFAPAAMGDHADHVLVRDAGLALCRAEVPVTLYADLPHAIARGWPTWVAGAAGVPGVDMEWELSLHGARLNGHATEARIHRLDADSLAHKIEALRAYVSQFPGLDAMAFRPLLNPGTLPYEVFWPL